MKTTQYNTTTYAECNKIEVRCNVVIVLVLLLCSVLRCINGGGWIPNNSKAKIVQLQSSSFLFQIKQRYHNKFSLNAIGRRRNNGNYNDDDEKSDKSNGNSIPQLPPIGSSSSSYDGVTNNSILDNQPFVANRKFQLQYTCNICETRNVHSISRLAYRQGVVIARCKGCDSQHLIADHLGWTDHDGGFRGNETNTIEDYFAQTNVQNHTNVTVNRVSTEVFELEKILQYNTGKSGAIVGDDGKLALE